jgi:O-antigen ligase
MRSVAVASRLSGLFAAGLALIAAATAIAAPRRLILILIVGLISGFTVAAVDIVTDGVVTSLFTDRTYRATRLNQASIAFAILSFPITSMLLCRGERIFAGLLAVATAAMICALSGTAAKTALFAGLLTGSLLYRSHPRVARIGAVISAIIIIIAPLTLARLERLPGLGKTADTLKISAGHRLLIWSFVGDRIAERALAGWGLDSSRAVPGGEDPIRPGETWLPLHPHNAPLQLWLELGAPGAVLFALLIALV